MYICKLRGKTISGQALSCGVLQPVQKRKKQMSSLDVLKVTKCMTRLLALPQHTHTNTRRTPLFLRAEAPRPKATVAAGGAEEGRGKPGRWAACLPHGNWIKMVPGPGNLFSLQCDGPIWLKLTHQFCSLLFLLNPLVRNGDHLQIKPRVSRGF